jgi:hypothetical protein
MFRFAVLAVGVASCGGGSLCQKWADELEGCDDGGEYDVEQCEEQLASCDGKDQKLLDDFYECMSDEGLLVCEDEMTETNMTDAMEMMADMFACTEPLEDLSSECQGGMMTGSTNATFF